MPPLWGFDIVKMGVEKSMPPPMLKELPAPPLEGISFRNKKFNVTI